MVLTALRSLTLGRPTASLLILLPGDSSFPERFGFQSKWIVTPSLISHKIIIRVKNIKTNQPPPHVPWISNLGGKGVFQLKCVFLWVIGNCKWAGKSLKQL